MALAGQCTQGLNMNHLKIKHPEPFYCWDYSADKNKGNWAEPAGPVWWWSLMVWTGKGASGWYTAGATTARDVALVGIRLFFHMPTCTCGTSSVSDQDTCPETSLLSPFHQVSIRRDLRGLWTAEYPTMHFTWASYSKEVCR